MNIGHLNSALQGGIDLLMQSTLLAITMAVLAGLYLLHLAKGLVSPRTYHGSTMRRPSQLAWSVPLFLVSFLIARVLYVLR
jgi:hypothetical protein